MGIASNSTHAAAPFLYRKLSYDPLRDFEHIGLFFTTAAMAMVRADSPFKSIPELVAYAKTSPGKVFFGHAATLSHISGELFKVTAGVPIEDVAYKSTANAITDLIGGHIQFFFLEYVAASAQLAGGRLLPIAITESKRNPLWPQIPSVAEFYPGFEVIAFAALVAPRGTPTQILARLNQAMREAQADIAFQEPLAKTGARLVPTTMEEYRAFLIKETQRWKEYVRVAKIQAQ